MRINLWLMLILCSMAVMLMCAAEGKKLRQIPSLGLEMATTTTRGQNNRAAQKAEQLLERAERHPRASRGLLRQAVSLVPPDNLTQARREVAACARAMSLDTSPARAPFVRHTPHDALRTVLSRGEYQILKNPPQPRWIRLAPLPCVLPGCWMSPRVRIPV